jgi:LysR family hydrogen peroxide-inducible transcriptional activator
MELHQIRYFLALCEELNFTRAAERCDVAQSSLTRAIKTLEDELGGGLFHRERANTHLSKLGLRIRPFLEQAYGQVEGARRQAQDFARLQAASLRLGILSTIVPGDLVALIEAMRTRHSEIVLHITDAPAEALQQRLLAGELDAAICAAPSLASDARFDHLPLYREPFVVALRAGHPLARQDAIGLKDLHSEARARHSHCEYEPALRDAFARQGVESPVSYQNENNGWVLAMVAAGMGYALMPEMSARASDIAVRPLVDPEIIREIALVTVRGRAETPGVSALVGEVIRWSAPKETVQAEVRLATTR